MLGLSCSTRDLCCNTWASLQLWYAGSWVHRLSSCLQASLPCDMWDRPPPGIEPVYSALAGRFLTNEAPEKPFRAIWSHPKAIYLQRAKAIVMQKGPCLISVDILHCLEICSELFKVCDLFRSLSSFSLALIAVFSNNTNYLHFNPHKPYKRQRRKTVFQNQLRS